MLDQLVIRCYGWLYNNGRLRKVNNLWSDSWDDKALSLMCDSLDRSLIMGVNKDQRMIVNRGVVICEFGSGSAESIAAMLGKAGSEGFRVNPQD